MELSIIINPDGIIVSDEEGSIVKFDPERLAVELSTENIEEKNDIELPLRDKSESSETTTDEFIAFRRAPARKSREEAFVARPASTMVMFWAWSTTIGRSKETREKLPPKNEQPRDPIVSDAV